MIINKLISKFIIIMVVYICARPSDSAVASGMPRLSDYWMPVGGSVTFTSPENGNNKKALGLGGEVSFLKCTDFEYVYFIGLYMDIVSDNNGERLSIGPEIGTFVILDGGYLYNIPEKKSGLTARILLRYPGNGTDSDLIFGAFMPYVRYGKYFDTEESFFEFGILGKIPIEINW